MFKNKTCLIILFFCIIKLILHLTGDYNSGFQGDEFLHIETGNHPGLGYMEFPPVIGWLAFLQNQFHSQSVFVHHICSHIASLLLIIGVALSTVELGGKTKSVFIVLLCIIVAPAFGRGQQLFQPIVFSQLFWILSFYQLVRFVKTPDTKYFLYLSISLAFGFLTKYDILFFVAGLSGLLLFKRMRCVIFSRHTWKYVLLFFLLISPNLGWQFEHQFPALQMFSRLYETQLEKLTLGGVLKDLILSLNPLTAFFWVGGFLFMFNKREKEFYRPIAVFISLSIFFLILSRSKAYYSYPVMLMLLMFGSTWFEQRILLKRKWIIYPAVAFLMASGIVLIPFGLAVLPLNSFIGFAHIKKKDNHYPVEYQEYYSRSKWENTLSAIKTVYDSLSPAEEQHCLIWGKHYSQAGAVNLYGRNYGLPAAFSCHGSFYLWLPEGPMPETTIAFTNGEAGIDFFQSFFNTVTPVKKVYNSYACFDKDLWQTIYICKNPRQDFSGLKAEFKTRIFE